MAVTGCCHLFPCVELPGLFDNATFVLLDVHVADCLTVDVLILHCVSVHVTECLNALVVL
jgi:hypothetical protein